MANSWTGTSWAQMVWADADLAVSSYTLTPDPIPNSGSVTFSMRVTNNGLDTVNDGELTIDVSPNTEVVTPPAGCVLSGVYPAPQTVTCTLPSMVDGDNVDVDYTATARSGMTMVLVICWPASTGFGVLLFETERSAVGGTNDLDGDGVQTCCR